MTHEQDRAAYEQDGMEAMIRMRDPMPKRSVSIPRADIGAKGPYDGTGSYDPSGAYIHLFISVDGGGLHTFRASRGGAEQLLRELQVALHLDLDRLTGSVIDAYTLAPNDEEEKRDAVRAAIARGLSA